MAGISFEDVKNLGKNFNAKEFSFDELKRMGKDNALQALGLQEQSSMPENALSLLAAFGAGMAAGLCAGMLLAPASGEESRRRIADGAQKANDEAQRAGGELADKARDQVKAS